jgi:uncharacterized protein
MPQVKIVLDTNGLLVLTKLFENEYELNVTTDILLEYEEKIAEIFSAETAELLIGALMLLPNVKKVDVHFHLQLIASDTDDNKFVDCAFAGNVNAIITDDKHFNELKAIGFPQLSVISLDKFKEMLTNS